MGGFKNIIPLPYTEDEAQVWKVEGAVGSSCWTRLPLSFSLFPLSFLSSLLFSPPSSLFLSWAFSHVRRWHKEIIRDERPCSSLLEAWDALDISFHDRDDDNERRRLCHFSFFLPSFLLVKWRRQVYFLFLPPPPSSPSSFLPFSSNFHRESYLVADVSNRGDASSHWEETWHERDMLPYFLLLSLLPSFSQRHRRAQK